MEWKK